MWNRKELKARGKTAFLANYWKCVLVALILTALVGGGAASGRNSADNAAGNGSVIEELRSAPREVLGVLAGALIGVSIAATCIKLLVFNPLQVGCKRFFIVNSSEPADLGEMAFGFKSGYGRAVAGMFLRDLFTTLWALLFIIPGVIKAYSYRMVPYILANDPNIGGREAINLSRQMMNGHKWRTFVLDLSFFGWYFLAAITAGIVNVFWTGPYTEATYAELYKTIRGEL